MISFKYWLKICPNFSLNFSSMLIAQVLTAAFAIGSSMPYTIFSLYETIIFNAMSLIPYAKLQIFEFLCSIDESYENLSGGLSLLSGPSVCKKFLDAPKAKKKKKKKKHYFILFIICHINYYIKNIGKLEKRKTLMIHWRCVE